MVFRVVRDTGMHNLVAIQCHVSCKRVVNYVLSVAFTRGFAGFSEPFAVTKTGSSRILHIIRKHY